MKPFFHLSKIVDVRLYQGDCLHVLQAIPSGTIDAFISDPPYGLTESVNIFEMLGEFLNGNNYKVSTLGFNGNTWDAVIPGPKTMSEVYRTLKPGAYAAVFAAKRNVDLMTLSLRIAGFEIKDMLMWTHSQGVPKSKPMIVKGTDFRNDLRPLYEPIILAKKPVIGKNIEDNIKRFGTGGLQSTSILSNYSGDIVCDASIASLRTIHPSQNGVALCHELIDGMYDSSFLVSKPGEKENRLWLDGCGVDMWPKELEQRKKYVNQSPVAEQNFHPTKKPIMLMSYLVRLLTTEGATVLDSFTGACTTGVAASLNNRNFIGVDLDARYLEIGKHRIQNAMDRRDNPQSNDYKYFSKFIDPSILTRQEKELREKIVNGTASIAERIIYRELISAEQILVFKKVA